jgi:hypothetical protein
MEIPWGHLSWRRKKEPSSFILDDLFEIYLLDG